MSSRRSLLNTSATNRQNASGQTNPSRESKLNASQGGYGNKKSGIVISKCYKMLCGSCNKRFQSKFLVFSNPALEIMLLDMTTSIEDQTQSVFDI